jgi:hypothetical protein
MDMITATDPVTNDEDIIDSRAVIERIEELTAALEHCAACDEEISETDTGLWETNDEIIEGSRWCEHSEDHLHAPEAWTDDEREEAQEELAALRELASDGETNAAEWESGATLIRDTYFEDYAREMAEDIGAIQRDMDWPCNHIDWEAAADELKIDYSTVDFAGVDYWVHS